MKRWRRRVLIGLALAVVSAWLFGGHRLAAPGLRKQLRAAIGIEPEIGFVLIGPDLNLYAYDISFTDPRLRAHVPWAKFEIPIRKLWGSGRTRAIRVRKLDIRVREGADLSRLGQPDVMPGGAPVPVESTSGPPPEFICEELEIRIEREGGEDVPLLLADWFTAIPNGTREIAVELGSGQAGSVGFDGITMRVLPSRRHLLVSDFKMRTFGGIVDGMLDVHLRQAGHFNGELNWSLLEVEQLFRYFGLSYAEKRRGKFEGELRFEATGPELARFKGTGAMRMRRAHFWSPVTFRVSGLLGLPKREESWVSHAELSFSVEKGLFYIETGLVRGAEYELKVTGIVDLDGACDVEAHHRGTTVAIRGSLEDPTVRVLPLNAVTVPFDRLFREKLRKRK